MHKVFFYLFVFNASLCGYFHSEKMYGWIILFKTVFGLKVWNSQLKFPQIKK